VVERGRSRQLPAVLRPIRAAISLAVLLGALWAAFAVKLGDKSFAEHVDTISETPEAKQLVDDTRATINPALVEVRDRVLGEYVEAPTWIPEPDAAKPNAVAKPPTSVPARELEARPEQDAEPPLPGRRNALHYEPPLPGRR
jgi:hypothetical protein